MNQYPRPARSLQEVLVSGCDERIFTHPETGRNKYFLNPSQSEGLFQRGSCTCGTLTASGLNSANAFLSSYPRRLYESLLAEQAGRIRSLFSPEDEFDVFFGPSGSDMMYLPLLFQALLQPNKPIVNIVSCPEELGSGSKLAAEAKYYAEFNQFGERVPKDELLHPNLTARVDYLAARGDDGRIVNRKEVIKGIVAENPNAALIGNLVFGSKSGIVDDLNIVDEVDADVMWVVDMCQFRTDNELVHSLLKKGVMVMITGSKFFQAPPFCGALLVPRSWTEKLRQVTDFTPVSYFHRLFSSYDFPANLPAMRAQLAPRENDGLRLRWHVALDEMEAYAQWPAEESNALIRAWNLAISERLQSSPYFELMPDQSLTNDSILSFRVKVSGNYLDNAQLKTLFSDLVNAQVTGLEGYTNVFIGQPVQYGERSFIRLAIGSYNVRKQLEKEKLDLTNDYRLVELLEEFTQKLFGA
jgi:hypothetical protein